MQTKRNGTETESKKEEGRNHIIYIRKKKSLPSDGRQGFFSAGHPSDVHIVVRRLFRLRTVVLNIVRALDFLIVVLLVLLILGQIVDLDVDLDEIADLLRIKRNRIEKIAVGFVNADHGVGKSRRILLFDLLLQLRGQIVKTCYKMFLICHVSQTMS